MRGLWRRKWLLMAATVLVFLSVGAGAWAATTAGNNPAEVDDSAVATGMLLAATAPGGGAAPDTAPGAALRQAMRDKMQKIRALKAKVLEELRDEMTPADQALYDQLMATLEQQREALQKAREDLKDTLEQLRDLGRKYLPRGTHDTDTTG